jgi:hypothetical protein
MQVFALWDKPVETAPDLVRIVFDRWRAVVPPDQFTMVDGEQLAWHIRDLGLNPDSLAIQTKSNLLRLKLLLQHGGVWTDATVWPSISPDWVEPLCDATGFFAFRHPRPKLPMSTWFLAAKPGNRLVSIWLDACIAYWKTDRRKAATGPADYLRYKSWRRISRQSSYASVAPGLGGDKPFFPYHWVHQLFAYLLDNNTEFAEEWARVPHRSALPPHLIQRSRELSTPESLAAQLPTLLRTSPVHKLNWKVDWPDEVLEQLRSQAEVGDTLRIT